MGKLEGKQVNLFEKVRIYMKQDTVLKKKIASQATKMVELTAVFMGAQVKYKKQIANYKENYVEKKKVEKQYEEDSVEDEEESDSKGSSFYAKNSFRIFSPSF